MGLEEGIKQYLLIKMYKRLILHEWCQIAEVFFCFNPLWNTFVFFVVEIFTLVSLFALLIYLKE